MRKTTETGRFTVRNPAFARPERPALLLASLAGAAMMGFAFSPKATALAADGSAQVAALTVTEQPVRQKAFGGTASDRICAGQAWGNETSDCLIALAQDAGSKQQARIRIIAIQ